MSGANFSNLTALPAWQQVPSNAITIVYPEVEPYWWSGVGDPPAIGQRVTVGMNALGPGVVQGYFVASGYLGIAVQLSAPPRWYMKQNGGNPPAKIFGAEA